MKKSINRKRSLLIAAILLTTGTVMLAFGHAESPFPARWQETAELPQTIATPEPDITQEPIYYDCTDDQLIYGAIVAALNRGEVPPESAETVLPSERPAYKEIGVQERWAVLCGTDGREVNFSSVNPSYIVAGPDHCFTLYFNEDSEAEQACIRLMEMEGIRYAEPDGEVIVR